MNRTAMQWIASIALVLAALQSAHGENWPAWRGPRGDGVTAQRAPIHWSPTSNVRWKTPLPGEGHASPIVWEDRIFIVAAIEEPPQRVLICLNRADGRILWQRTVLTASLERVHKLNSHASSTPATDGRYVYVSFLDEDRMFVAAYDFDGEEIWTARPGVFSSVHGYCSSPILWKNTVIVNGDHDGPGYLVALDKTNGEVVWKIDRPNNTRSYCTPIIRTIGGRTQLVLSGSRCVASYDPDTGKQHWIIDGPTEQFVASMVDNGELFFITAGFPQRHLMAIRPDGSGNVTETHIAWRNRTFPSYVPSPVIVGEYLYVVDDNGRANCFIASTGEHLWTEKIARRQSASLIAAAGLVYFWPDDGRAIIIKPGRTFQKVAENDLGEAIDATPAVSDGQLFIRTDKHLWCIEEAVTGGGD